MWPIGFALGVACLLVGLIVSWPAVAVGGAIAALFGFLWVRDLLRPGSAAPGGTQASTAAVAAERGPATLPRNKFLELSTLGLGGVIGGIVTLPPVLFMLLPPFLKQGREEVDVGPLDNYPEGKWVLARFMLDPEHGGVSERTAFIRNNGPTTDPESDAQVPSFTIISNRCAHLGCPTQQFGPLADTTTEVKSGDQRVMLQQALAITGFGCPCHGGAYDSEGNRTAGPPVRALDRYEFSIRRNRLYLGKAYSVGSVQGTGARARISKHKLASPGVHVEGWEKILYPVPQPPSS